jgi:hypothetical protein
MDKETLRETSTRKSLRTSGFKNVSEDQKLARNVVYSEILE